MKKTTMLKKNYEFRYILTKGKRYTGFYIDIYIKKNNLKENKLGIAISSKIANSVNRNKIKRLIRENYRRMEEKIDMGISMVVLLRKNVEIKKVDFFKIENDINAILKKANIISLSK